MSSWSRKIRGGGEERRWGKSTELQPEFSRGEQSGVGDYFSSMKCLPTREKPAAGRRRPRQLSWTKVISEQDWGSEVGSSRTVFRIEERSRRSQKSLSEEWSGIDQADRVLSRTDSFSSKRRPGAVEEESKLRGKKVESAPSKAAISLNNLNEIENHLEVVEEEFHFLLRNNQEKPDMDALERKFEQRRKLKKLKRNIEKRKVSKYFQHKWQSQSIEDIVRHIRRQPIHLKASFGVQGLRDESASEYFGRWGTLSRCEEAANWTVVEFYEQEAALRALGFVHPPSFQFATDPFPEPTSVKQEIKQEVKQIQPEVKQEVKQGVKQEVKQEVKLEVKSEVKSELETKVNIGLECENYSQQARWQDPCLIDSRFCIIIKNRNRFKTEEEMFNYFVKYGEVENMRYSDGTEIVTEELDARKEVELEFCLSESLIMAVNSQHLGIEVDVAREFMAPGPPNNKRKYSRNTIEHSSRSKYQRAKLDEGRGEGGEFKRQGRDGEEPRRRQQEWACENCWQVNPSSQLLNCVECGAVRPGCWECIHCRTLNTPNKLSCHDWWCKSPRPGTRKYWQRSQAKRADKDKFNEALSKVQKGGYELCNNSGDMNMQESGKNWAAEMAKVAEEQKKRQEEDRRSSKVIQDKLLKLAREFIPSSNLERSAAPPELVDLVDSAEEDEPVCKNANLVPISQEKRHNRLVQKNMMILDSGTEEQQEQFLSAMGIRRLPGPSETPAERDYVDLAETETDDETGSTGDGDEKVAMETEFGPTTDMSTEEEDEEVIIL